MDKSKKNDKRLNGKIKSADTPTGASGPSQAYVEPSDYGPSGPPSLSENVELSDYLEICIEEYLFGDLESITKFVPSRAKGNASFPMVLSICAGMEFLGALLLPPIEEEYVDHGRDCEYFGHYWKNYLGVVNAKYNKEINGHVAHDLIRNGLAHHFMVKFGIGTVRSQPERHLTIENPGTIFVIDADRLYEDFRKSYFEIAKNIILGGGIELASKRLEQIMLLNRTRSSDFRKKMSNNSQ